VVIAVPYQLGRAHRLRDLLEHDESVDCDEHHASPPARRDEPLSAAP